MSTGYLITPAGIPTSVPSRSSTGTVMLDADVELELLVSPPPPPPAPSAVADVLVVSEAVVPVVGSFTPGTPAFFKDSLTALLECVLIIDTYDVFSLSFGKFYICI